MDFFDEKKVGQALLYIATRVGAPVSKLVALKLLFLADRYHLRKYARPRRPAETFFSTASPFRKTRNVSAIPA